MQSEMSTIIYVNDQDEVLGEASIERAHREGLMCRVSAVYCVNEKGDILVQERADGGLDHSAAGHVDPGETYIQAAQRELFEELGVEGVELEEIGRCVADEGKSGDTAHIRHMFAVFMTAAYPGALEEREVKRVFWADPRVLWNEMQNDNDKKYKEGFKTTLAVFLKNRHLL